jgi:hypothetical protein
MQPTPASPAPRGGRGLLWLGIACAILGPVLYATQLSFGRMEVPWYAPALATLGVVLAFVAIRRRTTAWRGIALVFVAAFAGLQWWFLLSYVRLPAYTGPVAVGTAFPEFTAKRSDGKPYTRADLTGDPATALVFFRGHW